MGNKEDMNFDEAMQRLMKVKPPKEMEDYVVIDERQKIKVSQEEGWIKLKEPVRKDKVAFEVSLVKPPDNLSSIDVCARQFSGIDKATGNEAYNEFKQKISIRGGGR